MKTLKNLLSVAIATCLIPASTIAASSSQTRVESFLSTQKQVLIECSGSGYEQINSASGALLPLKNPMGLSILSLCNRGNDLFALCGSRGQYKIFTSKDGDSWTETKVPLPALKDGKIRMLANDQLTVLVNFNAGECFVLENGTWHPFSITRPAKTWWSDKPKVALLGSTLYMGVDRGEWGGNLQAIDLHTGKWTVVTELGSEPVRDLFVSADKTLWVVQGLFHFNVLTGKIWKKSVKGWTLLSSAGGKKNLNYPVADACFAGLAQSSKGAFYLVAYDIYDPKRMTCGLSISRLDNGIWKRITKWIPSRPGVRGLTISAGNRAVVPTEEEGIILWDLSTDKTNLVALP